MTLPLTYVCPKKCELSFLMPLLCGIYGTQKNSKSMSVSTKWKDLTLQGKNIFVSNAEVKDSSVVS